MNFEKLEELLVWGVFAIGLGSPILIIAAIIFAILALCTMKYPRLSLTFWILAALCWIPVVVVFTIF